MPGSTPAPPSLRLGPKAQSWNVLEPSNPPTLQSLVLSQANRSLPRTRSAVHGISILTPTPNPHNSQMSSLPQTDCTIQETPYQTAVLADIVAPRDPSDLADSPSHNTLLADIFAAHIDNLIDSPPSHNVSDTPAGL